MKKIYLLALAMAVSLSAVAFTPKASRISPESLKNVNSSLNLKASKALPQAAASRLLTPARLEDGQEDPIYDVDGFSIKYANHATGFVSTFFGVMYVNGVSTSEFVLQQETGDVYIKNIASQMPTETYVKGTYVDGEIVVKLPQVIYIEDYYGELYPYYVTVCELIEVEQENPETGEMETYYSYRNVDEENPEVSYVLDPADNSFKLDLNDGDPDDLVTPPNYILGVVADPTPGVEMWYGIGDAYQHFVEFTDETVTIPDNVELEEWAVICGNTNASALVGFDGDDVYFTNFYESAPDWTFKGRVEGDKVVVDANQYLGTLEGYFIYLMACEWEDDEFMDYTMLDKLVMNYDADGKVISTDNPLIDMLFNADTDEYFPYDYYENPTFQYQSAEDVNAAPADPWVKSFDDYQYIDWLGAYEGHIDWMIPDVNVKGFLLDTSRMYYHFLIDDEVMTFTTDLYPEFDQDYTDIPYDYTDEWDLQTLGESHYISFKWGEYTTLGCQSFFKGTDGETYASNLVTYDPAGIGVVATDGKEVKSVKYFDLQGRSVATPASGLYIVRYTFADGSSKVGKIVR